MTHPEHGAHSPRTEARLEDSIRVNTDRPAEVNYWIDRFGVSRHDLEQAVATVGSMAGDVAAWLRIRR